MNGLAAFLFDGAERNPISERFDSKLFFDLNPRASQQVLARAGFAFWNCPHSVIFFGEERPTGMRKQNLDTVVSAKDEQAGADATAFLFLR